jgi:cytochrome c6
MKIKTLVNSCALVSVLFAANTFAGDPFLGANIYNEHCVTCHGANGKGVIAGTPDFLQPSFMTKGDFQLKATIKAGSGIMPAYEGILKDREIMDVIAYIRTFN